MKNSKYEYLKPKMLTFLETLKVDDYKFMFTSKGDHNIYSSVLALYIYDLLGEVNSFSKEEKAGWVKYIQSHQNEQNGCFEPDFEIKKRRDRNVYQLTTFCYSALHILGAKPLYDLPFKNELQDVGFVDNFLGEHDCLRGARGSGNMAMFLGIFITYHYEKTGNELYLKALDRWFYLHNTSINDNGFWGERLEALYYNGVQNGFHQYVIYYYWNKPIEKENEIINVIRQIQDSCGHFAPFLGGAACEDYDAIHLILTLYPSVNNTPKHIVKILEKSYSALLEDINNDGGFCQSKLAPNKFSIKTLTFLLNNFKFKIFKIKLRKTLGFILNSRDEIKVNWFKRSRRINESNLWDSWFKALAIAEIEAFFNVKSKFNFQKTIGLGNYNKE